VPEFAYSLPQADPVLVDIFLAEADGYQALDTLRNHSRFAHTAIAFTADASVSNMHRAQESGFDGSIGEPLDPDRFPSQTRRVLTGEPVWEPCLAAREGDSATRVVSGASKPPFWASAGTMVGYQGSGLRAPCGWDCANPCVHECSISGLSSC
jgi:CheY-like chemotaxis protein